MSSLEAASRNSILSQARRIIIKLGTGVIVRDDGTVALSRLYSFIESIATLKHSGHEILLVSSGAVGLGAKRLNVSRGQQLLPLRQACAAVGQGLLMALYSDAFEKLGITSAQVLLTEEDFSNRRRYLNLRGTLAKLLELSVLPIINENDTVSTAELESSSPDEYRRLNFGDNDKLSALVASKMEADLLLILTDVEGIYDSDPGSRADARLIPALDAMAPELDRVAAEADFLRDPPNAPMGRGGIRTKVEAIRIAARSGCAAIIAGGKLERVIDRLFAGENLGTLIRPAAGFPGKRRWIAFATTVKAALVVNEGARLALVERKASLLAAGIVEVRGAFERGDVVSILDEQSVEFARGLVNYSSDEARKMAGLRSDQIESLIEDRNYDALITRDNIAML